MTKSTDSANRHYSKKMPILWWTKRSSHLIFILRELTSIAVAYTAIILLLLVRAIYLGEYQYDTFIMTLSSPIIFLTSIISLIGLIFHSITWFNLAPKAMVIKLGKWRIPGVIIALTNYVGWIVISVIIVWVLSSNTNV